MRKLEHKIRELENFKTVHKYLPNDNCHHKTLSSYAIQLCAKFEGSFDVLDLGCGEGDSIDFFKELVPEAVWHGVDIEDSPEVRKRTRNHESIMTFDGVNLPYTDEMFDLIYCNQVLEHVRFPDKLIAECFRVLKPNGLFLGSVSYLEPYHSHSVFNFTPFGIIRVFNDAGFNLEEIRPGIDAFSLISRQLFNCSKVFRWIWERNCLHFICDSIGFMARIGYHERNFLKIQFAGHLHFLARRPGNIDNGESEK